jgi:hypothetical protein
MAEKNEINESERINDFHEGGADKVFSENINKKTAEYGLRFDEEGKAVVGGEQIVELMHKGVIKNVSYHGEGNEDPESPRPRLDEGTISSLGNVELKLAWNYAHFSIDIVPEEIKAENPDLTKTKWVAEINLSKEEDLAMWYESRLHLGWTKEEVEHAQSAGIFTLILIKKITGVEPL